MKRAGWNPTRRNRNIGTSAQGHGSDNELVVPNRHSILARLADPCLVELDIAGTLRTVVVERTRPDMMHACTVDDLVHVLKHVDPDHLVGLDLFVLGQPTRKEEVLASTWGALRYNLQIGRHAGGALLLSATPATTTVRRHRSMSPDQEAEVARLRRDGADVVETRRRIELTFTSEGVRRVQLYRTVLHEIGHWVDFLQKVEIPSERPGADWGDLWERYWQRPTREGEEFAHRYADETRASLVASGAFPFERRDDETRMIELGLRPTDFACISLE